jgi:hypothetical protein
MIFESHYRRKALDSWENEKEATKKELREIFEKNNNLKNHPLKFVMTLFSFFLHKQQQN